MSRTANPERPAELLDAIVKYLVKHGLADLSLRPLAKAVGSSPRVLLYHFGSKENLVVEILAEIRRGQLKYLGDIPGETFAETCSEAWKRMSAPDSEPLFRVFFEAYGIALRNPKKYKDFLRETVESWLKLLADALCAGGYTRKDAEAFSTVILGGLRGFMLDFCNTHDRERVDRAVQLWAGSLDAMLSKCEKGQ